MENELFKSEQTNDILSIDISSKNHSAIFSMKQFDSVNENIKLFGKMVAYLKQKDIKWVIIKEKFHFELSQNMVWYKNKETKDLHCHIEDFEKFYLKNMLNFIKPTNIYIKSTSEDDDGWTTVVDIKKERINKIKKIKKEINNLVSDWNTL